MANELTKGGIIERNRAAAARMDAALARVTDEQMLAPREGTAWTLKDTLAHLAAPWFPAQMEAALDGRQPTAIECYGHEEPPGSGDDLSTNDGRNAWRQKYERGLSLAEVRQAFRSKLERMDRIVERLPESEFAAPYSIVPMGYVGQIQPAREGEEGFPFWQWIRGEYWHHLEDHVGEFETAEFEMA